MDGQALQERIRAMRVEIAAIQESEELYRGSAWHSAVDKAAHKARREALERIELELADLSKRKLQ